MRSLIFVVTTLACSIGTAAAQTAKTDNGLPDGWVEETEPSRQFNSLQQQRPYRILPSLSEQQRQHEPVEPSTTAVGGPSEAYKRYYNQFFANDAVDNDDDEGFGTIFGGKRRSARQQQSLPFNSMNGSRAMRQNYGGTYVTPFNQRTIDGQQVMQGLGAPMYAGPEIPVPYYNAGPGYVSPGLGFSPYPYAPYSSFGYPMMNGGMIPGPYKGTAPPAVPAPSASKF